MGFKKNKALVILLLCSLFAFAQKRSLNFNDIKNWPILENEKISDDGRYVAYRQGSKGEGYHLIIQATSTSWKKEVLIDVDQYEFTSDSRFVIFKTNQDTLVLTGLGTELSEKIGSITDFKVSPNPKMAAIAYHEKDSQRLVLKDLISGIEQKYQNVTDYIFSPQGTDLLLKVIDKGANFKLLWVDLLADRFIEVGKVVQGSHFTFDQKGNRLVYLDAVSRDGSIFNQIWYFQKGEYNAQLLLDDQINELGNYTVSDADLFFSSKSDRLIFSVEKRQSGKANPNPVKNQASVDVYNYKDPILQKAQLNSKSIGRRLFSVINLTDHRVIKLMKEGDLYFDFQVSPTIHPDYMIVYTGNHNPANYKWDKDALPSYYLISTADASRKLLTRHKQITSISFSPNGEFLIWYDLKERHWFSYSLSKGALKNISEHILTPLYQKDDHADLPPVIEKNKWIQDGKWVLVHDRFDIWQIDPQGKILPVNLTRGYGRKNHIVFRCLNLIGKEIPNYKLTDTLLLSAFHQRTKQNGFFTTTIGNSRKLNKLVLDGYAYYFGLEGVPALSGNDLRLPIKAKNVNCYILRRMSATEYPNIYFTNNFKSYKSITSLNPQNEVNWLSNELIHWKTASGLPVSSLLYKPENFDPHKKYPVIFFYYENRNADMLNVYLYPELYRADFNIPWFVSRGYVVCVPDINYKIGHPGRSALETVVSGADYLKQYSWVNRNKIGLQGHSFGGFETNYIVTHSNRFAAACSGAGTSNLVSAYGQILLGNSGHFFYENRQGRIGASLWQRRDLYIENSPLFFADKVSTPLLMLHNENDKNVLFAQGFEFYTALQRLGKKVWLLQYDQNRHALSQEADQLDFTIRMDQFFDHYLKDEPAPKWMTIGIPATRKGVDMGYELDPGVTP